MLEGACLSYKLLMIFFCQFNSLVPTTALLVEFAGELRSVSTCRRIATESGSPVISILSGVYRDSYRKPYEEQWSRRRKNKTWLPRGRNEQREESDILWYARAGAWLLQGQGREKERESGRRWIVKTGDERTWRGWRKTTTTTAARRDVATKSESTRWGDDTVTRRGGKRKIHRLSLSFSVAFRISDEACSKGEFNLCKFIMREHFAVYQWKSKTGIHRRARSSSFIIEPWCGPSFFPKNVQCRANNDDGERWYVLRHSFWLKVSAVLSRRCAWSLQACTIT